MSELPVSCIAIESSKGHSVCWYLDEQSCQRKYHRLIGDQTMARCTISRFELIVNDSLCTDRVDEIVEIAALDPGNEPLQRRIGTDRVHAQDGASIVEPVDANDFFNLRAALVTMG